MAPEIVKNLKVQTLITSMGSLPKKQVPEGNIVKYKNFLDAVFASDNIKIAVRNDGSRHAIKNDLGEAYSSRIDEVLDSGFFYSINDQEKKLVKEKYVAINAATDQVQLLAERDSGFSENRFYDELALSIDKIIHRLGMHVVLVPHVHGDLKAINKILSRLNDYDTRKYVSVGPCVQGDRGANSIFSLYKHSHCIVASRLHANVCAMAMHKNVIGLPVLDRVKSIHQSVGSDQFVSVHEPFSEAILSGIECFEIGPKVKGAIEKSKRETLDFYRTQLRNFS
jgi:polysaccharide pyruvyl transferase WcaK-like protein